MANRYCTFRRLFKNWLGKVARGSVIKKGKVLATIENADLSKSSKDIGEFE